METIPVSAFQQKQRPRFVGNSLMSPPRFIPSTATTQPELNFVSKVKIHVECTGIDRLNLKSQPSHKVGKK